MDEVSNPAIEFDPEKLYDDGDDSTSISSSRPAKQGCLPQSLAAEHRLHLSWMLPGGSALGT
eukprot:12884302-Prorocentrum_lima.AAC.1